MWSCDAVCGCGQQCGVGSRAVRLPILSLPPGVEGIRSQAYDRPELPLLASTVSAGVAAALVVAAYLIGTFPTAWLATRGHGIDPTREGSGNPGATNVLRVAGRRAGALALVGDVLKGAVPAAAGWAIGGHGVGVACGVAAVVGHVLPVTRSFRGGKGVATGAGMAVVLFPAAAAVAIAGFAVTIALTRTASLGSIVAAVLLPVGAAAFGAPGREVAALAGCAALIVGRHRANIDRLRRPARDRAARLGGCRRRRGLPLRRRAGARDGHRSVNAWQRVSCDLAGGGGEVAGGYGSPGTISRRGSTLVHTAAHRGRHPPPLTTGGERR